MRAMLQPWNVSVTAQEAGVAALVDCEAYLKRTREYIKKRKVLDDRADEKAWSECMGIGSKLYIF